MATHSSILTWEIQWTEEPGGLYIVHGAAKSWTRLSACLCACTHAHTHTHTKLDGVLRLERRIYEKEYSHWM